MFSHNILLYTTWTVCNSSSRIRKLVLLSHEARFYRHTEIIVNFVHQGGILPNNNLNETGNTGINVTYGRVRTTTVAVEKQKYSE